jgi:acetylornithine deacetylase/succinyl-diaminopimelate desuccinylase-like protein
MHDLKARLTRAWDQIDADFDSHLQWIRAYLRQPSIASTGEGISAGADMTAELVSAAGAKVEVVPTGGSPVVVGRIEGAGPSLVRYGMYDVQPAEEPDWTTPPFAAEIRPLDGLGPAVFARGAANSKGSLAAFYLAVESLRKVDDLPVTVAFMVDGEEEIGSPHLPEVVDSHRSWLAADAAFDLDLAADASGTPDVYLGCKGIVAFKLSCTGGDWGGPPQRALHSSTGVVIASPAWSLVRALAALNNGEQLRVPGVGPVDTPAEDAELVTELERKLDPERWLHDTEAKRFKRPIDARSLVNALLYEPVLNINGIEGGYPAGGKTIIPQRVHAILDMRVPYGVDPDAVVRAVTDAVGAAAPEVQIEDVEICPAARTPSTSAVAQAMVASHADVGTPALVWPSSPWWAPYYLFEKNLGVPFAIGGAGHGARAHAADEYVLVEGVRAHMKQSVAFLYRYAAEVGQ